MCIQVGDESLFKYWSKLLKKLGLNMARGSDPRVKYMGNVNDLVGQEERNFSKVMGKPVKRHGPDK